MAGITCGVSHHLQHTQLCAGITPIRTMALEFLRQGIHVTLLYGSRTQAEAAFLHELQTLAATNPERFKLVFSVSGKDGTWTGKRGRIDKALIAQQVYLPVSYVCICQCAHYIHESSHKTSRRFTLSLRLDAALCICLVTPSHVISEDDFWSILLQCVWLSVRHPDKRIASVGSSAVLVPVWHV